MSSELLFNDGHLLHFGLGDCCWAEVSIRWPDAELSEERFFLRAGQRYRIKQGEAPVELE